MPFVFINVRQRYASKRIKNSTNKQRVVRMDLMIFNERYWRCIFTNGASSIFPTFPFGLRAATKKGQLAGFSMLSFIPFGNLKAICVAISVKILQDNPKLNSNKILVSLAGSKSQPATITKRDKVIISPTHFRVAKCSKVQFPDVPLSGIRRVEKDKHKGTSRFPSLGGCVLKVFKMGQGKGSPRLRPPCVTNDRRPSAVGSI